MSVAFRRTLAVLAIVVLAPFLLLGAAIAAVQSEWGERFIERRTSERIGRAVEVHGIRVRPGWPLDVTIRRLRIANPEWAQTPNLVEAEGLGARVEVLPLLQQRFVVPFLSARDATAGLERSQGRTTWRFGADEQGGESPIVLHRVVLERGEVFYGDEAEKTALDVDVEGSLGPAGELRARASGRFRDEPSKVTVRIPSLAPSPATPIEIVAQGTIGRTKLAANGTLATTLETLDLDLELAGATMGDLRKVFGTNLPDTPPYRVKGHVKRMAGEWVFEPIEGRVGDSDLAGGVAYMTGSKRPMLRGTLKSRVLDLDDLGPVVGTPPRTGPGETASGEQVKKAAEKAPSERVLPEQRLTAAGWERMDADVRLDAKRLQRPNAVPLDSLSTRIVLDDSLLRLEPLSFGVAGGRISGPVTINARTKPARGEMDLDVQKLDLARLFPALDTTKQSVGTLYGRVRLGGQGDSIAALFGTSDGTIAFAIDGGRFSLLLVELLGLDVAEALQLLGTRNRQVLLRCAVGDFEVKGGVVTPRAFVIDTTDTVVTVTGTVDLSRETLDLVFRPEPKDPSIFALRSPIHLEGPFKRPKVRPEAGPIVARIAAAAALAALNPLLALIPFIETGPGKDSDCGALLARVNAKGATRKP